MFKQFIKRVIIFFIPFLFVFNVKCSNNIVRYYYDVNDTDRYVVSVTFDEEKFNVSKLVVYKISADGTQYDNVNINMLNDSPVGIFSYYNFLSDFVDSNYEGFKTEEEVYNDFKKDLEKYKPILLFDKSGNVIVVSPYFASRGFVDESGKYNIESPNIHDYDDDFANYLFSGSFDFYGLDPTPFYDRFNVDTSKKITLERIKDDSIDSDKKKDNNINDSYVSYTGGTCEKYYKVLKTLNEKIVGNGNVKGVCSTKSLNIMQNVSSLYDLKNNFDASVLEPECKSVVFGENGYIDTIYDALTYSYDNKNASTKLACLTMQSQYLSGISLLTSYTAVVDDADKTGCELIPTKVIDFINDLFDIFKVICICVCIFLCITDVYKMVSTKDDTKFKTVLVKRVIALVAVFLIPLFVNIVVDLVNDRYLKNNPDKCSNIIKK